jgi:hypothetical protein
MLKYGINDWNALHQDLYGELVFPLQVVINLSDPDTDYTGDGRTLCHGADRSRPGLIIG